MKTFFQKKNNKGYTLLEMLIVLMLIAIILPTIFSIIYILLQQQLRIYRLVETKRQGDRVMSYVKDKISREAGGVIQGGAPVCQNANDIATQTGNLNILSFVRNTGTQFSFSPNNTGALMARDQDTTILPTPTGLNDGMVTISNLTIQCFRRNTLINPLDPNRGVTLIGIAFTIQFNDVSDSPDELDAILQYQTKVRLR